MSVWTCIVLEAVLIIDEFPDVDSRLSCIARVALRVTY